MESLFRKLGVHIPEILLPAKGTDLTKWSVIACDQYTSQPEYWQRVIDEVNGSPSTLKLTLPEIYLGDSDTEKKLTEINLNMEDYVRSGILNPLKPGFILVDRSTPQAVSRKGLMLALDLEQYDFTPGSNALIRATEGTVLDRIPPRVKIRENALIELPHVMVLINDPEGTVIEELFKKTDSFEKLYDFDLMQSAGHIRGWKIDRDEDLSAIAFSLQNLCEASGCSASDKAKPADAVPLQNTVQPAAPFLFAVGDGNHSLATAKVHWENIKAAHGLTADSDHPARYALVEVVNLHDTGIVFEPIHRVLFGINSSTVLDAISAAAVTAKPDSTIEYQFCASIREMEEVRETMEKKTNCHILPFIIEGRYGLLTLGNPPSTLEAGTLQIIIDMLLRDFPAAKVDYIHGDQIVAELGSKKGCMGFYLPVIAKNSLFDTVITDGVLPKKTFSMGEAEEKRHYLECRRIR